MDNPIEKKAITQDKNYKSKQNKKERKGKKRDEDRVKDLYEQVKKHKAEQDDKENALNEGGDNEGDEKEEVTEESKSIKKVKVPPTKRDESQEKFKLAEAVAYLEQFKSYRDQWKFRKIVQVYIFQNLYTENKFDEDVFENILLYIKDSKGKARQSLLEEAKEIFESDNIDDTKEETKEEVKEEEKEEQKEEKTKESENKNEENIKKTGYSEFQKDRAYKIMSVLAE